jgi:hypothetical protein
MSLLSAQKRMGYPTPEEYQLEHRSKLNPCVDIDYESWGGLEQYHKVKEMYWWKFHHKKTNEEVAEFFDVPLEEVVTLLKEFRRYVNYPVKFL